MSVVPLNSFPTSTQGGGIKRLDVFNLSKAGAVQIGNILLHYENPNEEDIVECLRNAGLPPASYPAVDIYDPRYHTRNSIPIGRFDIDIEHKNIQGNTLIFPKITVDFFINETQSIVPSLIGGGEGAEQVIATHTITQTRLLKKLTANFSIKTQGLIRRLQMNVKRFNFKTRCHRRRILLLTTCILSKESSSTKTSAQEDSKYTLSSLFNDPRGGVFSECVAKWILSSSK